MNGMGENQVRKPGCGSDLPQEQFWLLAAITQVHIDF